MTDRATRLYMTPLRVDVTIRDGVPRVVPLLHLGRTIRAAALTAGAPTPTTVGLVLTDDAEMAQLNAEHMGKRGPTDVLSFPLLPPEAFARVRTGARPSGDRFVLPANVRSSLGDIVVSVERAIAQVRQGRGGQDSRTAWDAPDELLLLVIHGTLHLCGWDHAVPEEALAMRGLESRLMAQSHEERVDILQDRRLMESIRRSRQEASEGKKLRLKDHL